MTQSLIAKLIKPDAAPGEREARLAAYLDDKRDEGLLIFAAEYLKSADMFCELHKQHTAEIRRQGQLIERVANGRGE